VGEAARRPEMVAEITHLEHWYQRKPYNLKKKINDNILHDQSGGQSGRELIGELQDITQTNT
jgi:hypothetical protein